MTRVSGAWFLETLLSDEPTPALQLLAEDIVWTVPGAVRFGGGEHRGHAALLSLFARVTELFPRGLAIAHLHAVDHAAGSAIEAILSGTTATGQEYRNRYVFMLDVFAGRVTAVREYTDTAYAERVLRDAG